MIVAEGDRNVTDDDSTITHPEMIDELARIGLRTNSTYLGTALKKELW